MSDYKGNMNLLKLPGACFINAKSGNSTTRGLFVPIDGNVALYEGSKGLYLKFTVKEYKDGPDGHFGNTHNIRVSVDRSVYDSMSDEQRRALPFIGEMSPLKMETRHDAPVVQVETDDDGIF